LACRVLLEIVYPLARPIFGLAVLTARRDLTKDAEPLVLRRTEDVRAPGVGGGVPGHEDVTSTSQLSWTST